MKLLITLSILAFSLTTLAQTKIAFIEVRDKNGHLLQLEPEGRFAHMAISHQGKWLHAHPYRGVEIVNTQDLEKIGTLVIVTVPNFNEWSHKEIQALVGKPYNRSFDWHGDGFYCSELVAKMMNIPPEPMTFEAPIWKGKGNRGALGISPDDIYKRIFSSPYYGKSAPRCEGLF